MSFNWINAESISSKWLVACLVPSHCLHKCWLTVKTLRPRQNEPQFPGNIFKCIYFNENVWVFIKISLEFVPKGPINNIPALVQITAWWRPGDKPLSEPMMVSLLTHMSTALDLKDIIWSSATNFNEIWIKIIFIQENALQNVICKMLAILFRPLSVQKDALHRLLPYLPERNRRLMILTWLFWGDSSGWKRLLGWAEAIFLEIEDTGSVFYVCLSCQLRS